jgi:ABC-2 type transport system ATP-binding protein
LENDILLVLENVSKTFDRIPAFRDISFRVQKSTITMVIGPDGAGKTTLLKTLIGLEKMDSGKIFYNEKQIGDDFHEMIKKIGYMPEKFSLYPDLSVDENLDFFADIHRISRKEKEAAKKNLLLKTGLTDFKKRRTEDLSGGMRQKLALACVLLSSPEMLLLDEPTTGIDPLARIEFLEIMKELKNEGKIILMTSAYLDEAEKGDQIIFLKDGEVVKKGTVQQLKKNFPAKVYRILPRGNPLEAMEDAKKNKDFECHVYVRGKFLRILKTHDREILDTIPHISKEETEPTLEDVYIYFERSIR